MWNAAAENMLLKWSNECKVNSILFAKAATYAKRRDRWFGIPMTVLGAIMTSSVFVASVDSCEAGVNYTYFSGGLALVYTVLTSVGKWLDFSRRAAEYFDISSTYERIIMSIEEQLSRPLNDRLRCSDFVTSIKTNMVNLRGSAPLPSAIQSKYLDHIVVEDLVVPPTVSQNEACIVRSRPASFDLRNHPTLQALAREEVAADFRQPLPVDTLRLSPLRPPPASRRTASAPASPPGLHRSSPPGGADPGPSSGRLGPPRSAQTSTDVSPTRPASPPDDTTPSASSAAFAIQIADVAPGFQHFLL